MAIRALRAASVAFVPHLYPYEPHGGTRASSVALGVSEHAVIKTLIFETERGDPLCILMHGDCEVSGKQLARLIGTKSGATARRSGSGPAWSAAARRRSPRSPRGTSRPRSRRSAGP